MAPKRPNHGQMSESFYTVIFLSLSGGLQDAYTYLFRGGVFANAQTGNIVLLSVRLFEGDWAAAGHYLIPLLAFSLGILVAELVRTSGAECSTGGSWWCWGRSRCSSWWASCPPA